MEASLHKIFKRADELRIENEQARLERRLAIIEAKERRFYETEEQERIHSIDTCRIVANPNQPRSRFESESIIRLADSIRRYGILQPLTVRRIMGENTKNGLFELVAGERRLRAAKLLGLCSVPCIIIKADPGKSAELAIIENIQREDLNMFEQASAFALLSKTYGLTQEEIAKRLSSSQSLVANKLRLLKLSLPEREKILQYGLTERHARALLAVDSPDERLAVIEYINAHSLNVAATEAYIQRVLSNPKPDSPSKGSKVVLKDIKVFYNSIDRAISLVKQAGIEIESTRTEADDAIELLIRIPK